MWTLISGSYTAQLVHFQHKIIKSIVLAFLVLLKATSTCMKFHLSVRLFFLWEDVTWKVRQTFKIELFWWSILNLTPTIFWTSLANLSSVSFDHQKRSKIYIWIAGQRFKSRALQLKISIWIVGQELSVTSAIWNINNTLFDKYSRLSCFGDRFLIWLQQSFELYEPTCPR